MVSIRLAFLEENQEKSNLRVFLAVFESIVGFQKTIIQEPPITISHTRSLEVEKIAY